MQQNGVQTSHLAGVWGRSQKGNASERAGMSTEEMPVESPRHSRWCLLHACKKAFLPAALKWVHVRRPGICISVIVGPKRLPVYGILNCPPSVSSLSRVLMDSAVFPCHIVGMVIAAQGFPSRLLIYPQLVSFKYPTESRYTPGGYLTQHRRDAQASIPRYHVFSPETLCGIRSCSGYSCQTSKSKRPGIFRA